MNCLSVDLFQRQEWFDWRLLWKTWTPRVRNAFQYMNASSDDSILIHVHINQRPFWEIWTPCATTLLKEMNGANERSIGKLLSQQWAAQLFIDNSALYTKIPYEEIRSFHDDFLRRLPDQVWWLLQYVQLQHVRTQFRDNIQNAKTPLEALAYANE